MPSVKQALLQALADLDSLNVDYAVIGGLAVSARIEPRMTRDVDFAVSVNDDSGAEEILFKLQQLGYVVDSVIEQTAVVHASKIDLVMVKLDKLLDVRLVALPPSNRLVDDQVFGSGHPCLDGPKIKPFSLGNG